MTNSLLVRSSSFEQGVKHVFLGTYRLGTIRRTQGGCWTAHDATGVRIYPFATIESVAIDKLHAYAMRQGLA